MPAGLIFYSAGVYRVQFSTRFPVLLDNTKAAAIVHNLFGSGAVIYAEGMTHGGNVAGLEGNFLIPVTGDGDATESWYPALDVSGSGTFNIVGDGNGLGTWLTVEKVA